MRACSGPRDRTSNNEMALGTGFPAYRCFHLGRFETLSHDRLCHRKEDAEGFRLRRGTASPPVSCVSSVGRRKSLPKRQRLHPTRVVAQVGTCWRASAHKGSPLFPRRAPGLITVDPERSLDPPLTASRMPWTLRTPSMLWTAPARVQRIERPFEGDPRGRGVRESGQSAAYGGALLRIARAWVRQSVRTGGKDGCAYGKFSC